MEGEALHREKLQTMGDIRHSHTPFLATTRPELLAALALPVPLDQAMILTLRPVPQPSELLAATTLPLLGKALPHPGGVPRRPFALALGGGAQGARSAAVGRSICQDPQPARPES